LLEGEARFLLTSSSFSRINFSVSARGSMGSGISVALWRESLLGDKEKRRIRDGAGGGAWDKFASRRRGHKHEVRAKGKEGGESLGGKSG
jgi:hypothetical protein